MLTCQKHLFDFEDGVTYLNGAYMSPLLKSVTQAGIEAMRQKSKPWNFPASGFFGEVERLKNLVSNLLNTDEPQRIVVIPSVSYGIATVAKNISFSKGDHILVLDKQFPSNYFTWKKLASDLDLVLDIATPPTGSAQKGADWNTIILESIKPSTKVVSIEHIHWADGTWFDIAAIRKRSREVGALLVVDLTQSLGAFPFDQSVLQADAIIAAGYKFLLGPYAMGIAYYGAAFDQGIPLEENWINRKGSNDFEKLLDYIPEYRSGAARYGMGEQSQLINVPMQIAAIEQITSWGVEYIQHYCKSLVDPILPALRERDIWIEDVAFRANHLFGIKPKGGITSALKEKLLARKIFVSYRSDTIRVSPNVYNTTEDLQKLVEVLSE